MKQDFTTYLLARPGLTDLVGAGVQARIGWGKRNQGASAPAIVLRVVDARQEAANSGPVNLCWTRLEANCWAETYAQAEAVAAIVRTLHATRFDQGSTSFAAFVAGEGDAYDADTPAPDKLFGIRLDLDVWHSTTS